MQGLRGHRPARPWSPEFFYSGGQGQHTGFGGMAEPKTRLIKILLTPQDTLAFQVSGYSKQGGFLVRGGNQLNANR